MKVLYETYKKEVNNDVFYVQVLSHVLSHSTQARSKDFISNSWMKNKGLE